MSIELPAFFHPKYKAEDIQSSISRLGFEIKNWSKDKDMLCLCVLKGSLYFFADLTRELGPNIKINFITASSYQNNKQTNLIFDLKGIDVKNKDVIIIDDICDTGNTLHLLRKALVLRKPKSIKTVCLIKRNTDEQMYSPDWFAFEYFGDEWFVGYGMDYYEEYRNLKDIYIVDKDV